MIQKDEIGLGERELVRLDPMLGRLITVQGSVRHTPRSDYFASLTRSIISQQVSVAASTSIFARFETVTGLVPERVVKLSMEDLRAVGLSRQKASYLHDLSQHFVTNPAVFDHLDQLCDDEVIAELTGVKGIGVWTAQMFLMFTLTRLDVFAPDDIGLQRAMKMLYGWNQVPSKAELERVAAKWRPYRTIACWQLWRSLQNDPIKS